MKLLVKAKDPRSHRNPTRAVEPDSKSSGSRVLQPVEVRSFPSFISCTRSEHKMPPYLLKGGKRA